MLLKTSEKNPNSKSLMSLMDSPRISGGQGSEGSDLTENVLGHGWSLMAFTQEVWHFMSGRGGGGERRAGKEVRRRAFLERKLIVKVAAVHLVKVTPHHHFRSPFFFKF